MKRSAPITRKAPLDIGAKARERGSSFASRGDGLKRTEIAQRKADGKRRKASGFTPASPEQRAKVLSSGGSIVSGEWPVDPAHLTPRAYGGCDDPLCVVPLTRAEHRAFDDGKLDVLPYLLAHGMWAEMAHAIEVHHIDPVSLLQRCTGERWAPVSDSERPSCGCDNPLPGWQAGVSYCGNCGWHVADASLGASEAAA